MEIRAAVGVVWAAAQEPRQRLSVSVHAFLSALSTDELCVHAYRKSVHLRRQGAPVQAPSLPAPRLGQLLGGYLQHIGASGHMRLMARELRDDRILYWQPPCLYLARLYPNSRVRKALLPGVLRGSPCISQTCQLIYSSFHRHLNTQPID